MKQATVAIVGGGPFGLAAVKNLRDEGFDVTCFEKRDGVGGLWAFTEDPNIASTLSSTISNVTKYRSCFTDFPVSDDAPPYLPATQVHNYIKSYAEHFDILPHVKFNTTVQRVVRSKGGDKWRVDISDGVGESSFDFDKVLFCNGLLGNPYVPEIEGRENFQGQIIHSQAFKRPADFVGKNVVVLGMGNTAADTATSLVGHAEKIYLSHRKGANLLPRVCLGKPLDLNITRRLSTVKQLMADFSPRFSKWYFDRFVSSLTTSSFKLDPSWRIHPPPSILNHQPTINDDLVNCLHAGTVLSVYGIRSFVDATTIELDDGTLITADTVVLCTGYNPCLDLMPELDPRKNPTTLQLVKDTGYSGPPLVNLYHNIISPEHPYSIAYLNCASFTEGAVPTGDLSSMAVAQIWAGKYKLPSKEALERSINEHHAWVASVARDDTVYAGLIQDGPFFRFLNDAAGTGVNEKLGYGLQGWLYWCSDPWFCNVLMTGVMSAHVFRLFETGRRKSWKGAREAIIKANEKCQGIFGQEMI